MKRRVAYTAASQPLGTAMPNCTGAKKDESFDTACLLAHLAANLLHTYPIAIGLRPPVSLLRAIKLPPKRVGLTDGGHSPLSSKFVKSGSASASGRASSPDPTRSNRCTGLKPSGPPADPFGKVRTASSTSSTDTCHAPITDGSGSLVRASGSALAGCFSLRSARLSPSGIARFPPSHRMRIAARMLPTSSLEPMAASIISSWLRCRLAPVDESSFTSTISEPLVHPSTLALITVVILRRLPALGGWPRIAGAKFSRALQLSMDLGFTHMSLRTEARALAQAGRAPLQMCFSSGPRYGGCASCSPFTTFDTPLGATSELPRGLRSTSPPISLVGIIVPPPCSRDGRLDPTHRVALGP